MDIQLPQILFQAINFGVVMGALTYLLYKPIQKLMDERAAKIAEGQAAAETAVAERENLESQKRKLERENDKKAAELIEHATEKAMTQKQEILAKAKTEAQAEVEKLKEQWSLEKAQLKQEMRQEMIEAVMAVTEKVIGQKLSDKADAKLIADELAKLAK
jgi:F-type H+-transporting ATPase subunit b